MTAINTKTAGDKSVKASVKIGGIGTDLDCLAYFLWVEKWLRSQGENRLADDYAYALKEGESICLAA